MRVLVAGLGSMGRRRVRCLRSLEVDWIGGFDVREDRRREAADRYGIPTFASLEEGLAARPGALVVSTPPEHHLGLAHRAVREGLPFFVETGVFEDGIGDLIDSMRAGRVTGSSSCTMRNFAGPRRVKALVAGGAIGRPLHWMHHCGQYLPDWHPWESIEDFYVSHRATGGCRELVPFELGWLTDVFGPIAEVDAQVDRVSDLPADIDDVYRLLVRHESGVAGSLVIDVVSRPAVRHFRVAGAEGSLEWDQTEKRIRRFEASRGEWVEESLEGGRVEAGYVNPDDPYVEEIRDFLAAVRGEGPPPYSFEELAVALRVLLAAEASALEGRRMRVV